MWNLDWQSKKLFFLLNGKQLQLQVLFKEISNKARDLMIIFVLTPTLFFLV